MKYAPKKVFILVDGRYQEISYREFCSRKENDIKYRDKLFLPQHGMLLEVTAEDYKRYYQEKRRQKYIEECARENGEFSYDALTTENFNGEDILVSNADLEEQVERRWEINQIREALNQLSEDEQKLIKAIYFEGITEREYAKREGVYHNAIHKRKQRILDKLKKLLEK